MTKIKLKSISSKKDKFKDTLARVDFAFLVMHELLMNKGIYTEIEFKNKVKEVEEEVNAGN